jgi:hypothetical protein
MVIEFVCDGDIINCILSIDSNFVSISSALILHDLVNIDVKVVENDEIIPNCLTELDELNANTFSLNIQYSRY